MLVSFIRSTECYLILSIGYISDGMSYTDYLNLLSFYQQKIITLFTKVMNLYALFVIHVCEDICNTLFH